MVIVDLIILAFSVIMLVYTSDYFTEGAAKIARRFGVSKFVIGAVIVGFGTSSPEFFSSIYASISGVGGVAVGNVIGSNIANIALILGLAAFIRPVVIRRQIEFKNGILCFILTLLSSILILSGRMLSRPEGLLLLTIFVFYVLHTVKRPADSTLSPDSSEKLNQALFHLLVGLVGVLTGSILLVDSAVAIARAIGVSESVIGATIVAFGTSVPELAVSIAAAKKGYLSMIAGNILGSNVFNIILILGAAVVVNPILVDDKTAYVSTPIMIIITAIMLVFMKTDNCISRREGLFLLLSYLAFLAVLFV